MIFLIPILLIFILILVFLLLKKKRDIEDFTLNLSINSNMYPLIDLNFSSKNFKFKINKEDYQYYIYNDKNLEVNFIVEDKLRNQRMTHSEYFKNVPTLVKNKKDKLISLSFLNNFDYKSFLSFNLGNTYISTIHSKFKITGKNPLHILFKGRDNTYGKNNRLYYIAIIKSHNNNDHYNLVMDRVEFLVDYNDDNDYKIIKSVEDYRLKNKVINNQFRIEFPNLIKINEWATIDIIKDYNKDSFKFTYYVYKNGDIMEQGSREDNLLTFNECTIGEYFNGYIEDFKLYSYVNKNIVSTNLKPKYISVPQENKKLKNNMNLFYADMYGSPNVKYLSVPKGFNVDSFKKIDSQLKKAHIIKGFDDQDEEEIIYDNKYGEKINKTIAPKNIKGDIDIYDFEVSSDNNNAGCSDKNTVLLSELDEGKTKYITLDDQYLCLDHKVKSEKQPPPSLPVPKYKKCYSRKK